MESGNQEKKIASSSNYLFRPGAEKAFTDSVELGDAFSPSLCLTFAVRNELAGKKIT